MILDYIKGKFILTALFCAIVYIAFPFPFHSIWSKNTFEYQIIESCQCEIRCFLMLSLSFFFSY